MMARGKEPVVIDGSFGEGGGQILRTSIALSAVTGRPVKIVNIRAKRRNPGLRRQHITGIKAVAALSKARVEGLELGSTTLLFELGKLSGGEYRFDIGTAGSVTLVLQALLPLLPFLPEPTTITVTGGTDVPWSPTIDYFRGVLLFFLEKMGFHLEIDLVRRGHYPRGGGMVRYRIRDPPGRLKPLELVERGEVHYFMGRSHAVKLPRHVAERQARAAVEVLRENYPGVPMQLDIETDPEGRNVFSPGSGIAVWAICDNSILGADSLGERGKPAEKVGGEAARVLIEDLATGKALDRHMSDMIIPFLALAEGKSRIGGARLTMHALTNIHVVQEMLNVKINYRGDKDKPFTLEVEGRTPD